MSVALEISLSTIEKYTLTYSNYFGDGDTSFCLKVVQAKPYGEDLIPMMLEYVGHVQKRDGSCLPLLQKSLKSKALSYVKGILRTGHNSNSPVLNGRLPF